MPRTAPTAKRPLPTLPLSRDGSARESAGCALASLPSGVAQRARALVPMFKALADETRVEIVALLATQERELCACEIEACFDLSQSTISHHMKILRDAGLVSAERRASWVFYGLEEKALGILRGFRSALGL